MNGNLDGNEEIIEMEMRSFSSTTLNKYSIVMQIITSSECFPQNSPSSFVDLNLLLEVVPSKNPE